MNNELYLFDKANFGVLRTDREGQLTYLNDWLRRYIGARVAATSRLRDFVSDPQSLETLRVELDKRLRGEPGEYMFALDADNDRRIEMQVFGTPIRDAAGQPAGSVAFLTRLPNTRLSNELLAIDCSKLKASKAFDQMREALQSDFKFDAMVIGIYDPEGEYGRLLYSFFRNGDNDWKRWGKHWGALTPLQKRWMLHSTAADRAIGDLDAFMEHPHWRESKSDPFLVELRNKQVRSVACALVRDGQKLAASISLFSQKAGAYQDQDVIELEQLPLDRCVLAVMRRLADAETEFRYDLVKVLSRCSTVYELANCVVKKLCKHYGLARTALYGIDWATNTALLEACSPDSKDERACGPLPLDEGHLVAQVAHSGHERYVPNVKLSGEDKPPDHGSEFCWPAVYSKSGEKRVRWVFYAEDHRPGAFHPAERRSLRDIAGEVSALLKPLTALHFLQSTFDATSDAIVVVDAQRQIKRANPAAAELLGFEGPKDIRGNIEQLLRYPEDAAKLDSSVPSTTEVKLRDVNQHLIEALVSIRPLPPPIDGRVMVMRDLSKIRRLEELGFLGRLAGEIAVQAQTPLTLASSWVQRIHDSVTGEEQSARQLPTEPELVANLAMRTMTQLHRIQSVLDRIAFYDSTGAFKPQTKIPLSLADEVATRIKSLPQAEQDRVRAHRRKSKEPIVVEAHRPHLAFVLDTMLAFFLRDLPAEGKVSIRVNKSERCGWVSCSVPRRPSTDATTSGRRTMAGELNLIAPGLKKILQGYGGDMQIHRSGGRVRQARITLPQVQ